jgi:hypothetical protein
MPGGSRHQLGIAIPRQKRAGRIKERDGKLYATQSNAN